MRIRKTRIGMKKNGKHLAKQFFFSFVVGFEYVCTHENRMILRKTK